MPASPDKFVFTFSQLPISDNVIDNKQLSLHLFDAVIPGISFETEDED
jgi:hypothetical protein